MTRFMDWMAFQDRQQREVYRRHSSTPKGGHMLPWWRGPISHDGTPVADPNYTPWQGYATRRPE